MAFNGSVGKQLFQEISGRKKKRAAFFLGSAMNAYTQKGSSTVDGVDMDRPNKQD